jgi:DNA helicase II / ATP-dependent DNA helicase PcrA
MWLPGLDGVLADPNPGQAILRLLGPQNVLALAPAGCGKTRALAGRAEALIRGGAVAPPRRILALTFSNRARDNLRANLRALMGPAYRSRVTVANFHGFAARIIRSHGPTLDISSDLVFPERGWRASNLQQIVRDRRRTPRVEAALREVKSQPVDDQAVLDRLAESGVEEAFEFEELLRAEGRLDFDDLLRHAERLLLVPQIAHLYRNHFSACLVDEVQDLTEQQLRIAQLVGESRLTAAGDPSQGIYGFAGARPDAVFQTLLESKPAIVTFGVSYRSAPAVLVAVNRLAKQLGGEPLTCANPEVWPDEGHVAIQRRDTLEDETGSILEGVEHLLRNDAEGTVGIISRRRDRRRVLERALLQQGHDFEAWDVPTHNAKTLSLLRRVEPIAEASAEGTAQQVSALEALAKATLDSDDFDALDDVIGACSSLRDLVGEGLTLTEALARCRRAPPVDAPVSPGLHLLNAHLGKGQQFDWVFILGLEEGHIPDFRATTDAALQEELRALHVMVSRARFGIVITVVRRTQNPYGRWFHQTESRWLSPLEETATEHR